MLGRLGSSVADASRDDVDESETLETKYLDWNATILKIENHHFPDTRLVSRRIHAFLSQCTNNTLPFVCQLPAALISVQ